MDGKLGNMICCFIEEASFRVGTTSGYTLFVEVADDAQGVAQVNALPENAAHA